MKTWTVIRRWSYRLADWLIHDRRFRRIVARHRAQFPLLRMKDGRLTDGVGRGW